MPLNRVFKVIFYSPDRHIVYDGRTPYEAGIGGGVTARIRMARALALAGQHVRVVCNCLQAVEIDGVEYVPLDQIQPTSADVLIANTSGGDYDLDPLGDLPIEADLRLVWMSGVDPPAHLDAVRFDGVYAKSNFLLQRAEKAWGFPTKRIWVFYNGFEERLFSGPAEETSSKYRLVYASHPSKGLDTALEVTRRLRSYDARFHLMVCGGELLWGRPENQWIDIPGVHYAGLLPQSELVRILQSSTFSLVMQSRPEPFGMIVTESQRAGCVVLASPVGALTELIQDGVNGMTIQGNHQEDATRQQAAQVIMDLIADQERLNAIQQAARAVPWSAGLIARAWIQHWEALLDGKNPSETECPSCGSSAWLLTDGVHCLNCRTYTYLSTSKDHFE